MNQVLLEKLLFIEISKIEFRESLLSQPEKERKYLSMAFAAFIRYPSHMQQCADSIVRELYQLHSKIGLQTCIIGNECNWWVDEANDTYLNVNGFMGMNFCIWCGDSTKKLRISPTRTAVESVLFNVDDVSVTKVRDALNEHFPTGWNIAKVEIDKVLVVSFMQSDLEKLYRFECRSRKYRYILWAWKA